jgi:hypothetical protein
MLRVAEGGTIWLLVSAGNIIIPPRYASGIMTPITWGDATDQLLIDLVNIHGRRWKSIYNIWTNSQKVNIGADGYSCRIGNGRDILRLSTKDLRI